MTEGEVRVLFLSGGGDVRVEADGTLRGARKADYDAGTHTLTAQGEGSGSTVVLGSGGGCISFQGMTFNNHAGSSVGTIHINGERFTMDDLRRAAAARAEEAPAPASFTLTSDSRIETIRVSGSGALVSVPAQLLADRLAVTVQGSGDVMLPAKEFEFLAATVQGSGDVTGVAGTHAKRADIKVVGSGDVTGVHVTRGGTATVVGSGDIRISEARAGMVHKTQVGSGDVRVTAHKKAAKK